MQLAARHSLENEENKRLVHGEEMVLPANGGMPPCDQNEDLWKRETHWETHAMVHQLAFLRSDSDEIQERPVVLLHHGLIAARQWEGYFLHGGQRQWHQLVFLDAENISGHESEFERLFWFAQLVLSPSTHDHAWQGHLGNVHAPRQSSIDGAW